MAVPGAIIAASLYSQDVTLRSPLAGLVFSGYGTQRIGRTKELTPRPGTPSPSRDIGFAPEVKQVLTPSDPKLQCYDPEVVKQKLVQDHNIMMERTDRSQRSLVHVLEKVRRRCYIVHFVCS
jgi:hypothetical protein